MDYSIKILQDNLDKLNSRYERFVSNGSVEITSIIALDNRKKARHLEQAITELNQALQLQQTGVMPRFISLVTSFDFNSINEKIDWLGIQREDIISLQHTKNDGFCLYYFKNEA
ncbi:MAG: hypothetical protein RSE15_03980 [Flavobacterium sp.]|uniref:hypothetical protein n=1 Tax=Flavobacterium sp. TaxID=239 RepID=UPI002B479E22|nr:hypothetical protein [Flavobacterium sp.]WRH73989.1 MAG: hypothetical protein RSE15_03980 [Flavobacterium sp.]